MTNDAKWVPLFVVWLISVVATLGSLFFSEVMGLPPCTLCWYQRIAMYPVAIVSTVGLLGRDSRIARYLWPLVFPGLVIATYHCLLYHGLVADSITPCSTGVSCTERQIAWFGFISIPLLSFSAFVGIAAGLVWFQSRMKDTQS